VSYKPTADVDQLSNKDMKTSLAMLSAWCGSKYLTAASNGGQRGSNKQWALRSNQVSRHLFHDHRILYPGPAAIVIQLLKGIIESACYLKTNKEPSINVSKEIYEDQ
jgi:hypothetical protein